MPFNVKKLLHSKKTKLQRVQSTKQTESALKCSPSTQFYSVVGIRNVIYMHIELQCSN